MWVSLARRRAEEATHRRGVRHDPAWRIGSKPARLARVCPATPGSACKPVLHIGRYHDSALELAGAGIYTPNVRDASSCRWQLGLKCLNRLRQITGLPPGLVARQLLSRGQPGEPAAGPPWLSRSKRCVLLFCASHSVACMCTRACGCKHDHMHGCCCLQSTQTLQVVVRLCGHLQVQKHNVLSITGHLSHNTGVQCLLDC